MAHAGRPPPRRTVARAGGLHLGLGLAALAVFVLGPVALRTPAMAVILVAALTGLHVGPRRNVPPEARAPWRMLTAAANPELGTVVAMADALDADVVLVPRKSSRQRSVA